MATLTDYKGLDVLDAATGAGGAAINDDLKKVADRAGPVHAASSNPSADDDSSGTAGNGKFYAWSKWRNTSNDKIFICLDPTPTAAVWVDVNAGSGTGTLPKSYVDGLRLSFVSVSSVQVAAGVCRDSANSFDIILPAAATVSILSSGANGLDTGSEAASTWYAVHVIADSTGVKPTAGLLSTSPTAPTLPTGYNRFRRVGWVRNNASSDFLKFNQRWEGRTRRHWYDESGSNLSVLSGGTATTFTGVSLAGLVPPTSQNVILGFGFTTAAGSDLWFMRRTGDSANNTFAARPGIITVQSNIGQVEVPADSSQSIDYRVSSALASLDLGVQGFDDEI